MLTNENPGVLWYYISHRDLVQSDTVCLSVNNGKKVQVGKDQEKAQPGKDSHSKNRGGKKQTNNQVLISGNTS